MNSTQNTQKLEDIVKCDKGWHKLYTPIVNMILAHDLAQLSPDKKIGIETIRSTCGYLDIKVINYKNLNERIINKIHEAQIQSEHTCEICGSQENVGSTMFTMRKHICCEKCYNDFFKSKMPLVSWNKS